MFKSMGIIGSDLCIYVPWGAPFFIEGKKYGARYLAQLVAKAGGGLPADYP
jgi:hypothetical protein